MPSDTSRRIAKNTIMLYIRMSLILAVTFYTSRIILNILGVEDFGIYNVVGGIVLMFAFLNGAMSQSTQRFLSFEVGRQDWQQLRKIFSLSVTLHIGIALIILLLAETLGLWFLNAKMNIPPTRMEAARWVYHFSVFSFMVSVAQVPYNALIIAHERMHVYAYISIAEVLLKLLVVFVLSWISYDKLKAYALLVFGVTVLVALIYRFYCAWKFGECRYRFIWDKALYKELTNFAGWSMFGTLAWLFKSQGLNLVLNIFFGPLLNAAYGIANQVNTAINSFVLNFTTAVNPQIVKSYAIKEMDYMRSLLFRGSKFSYFLLLFFVLPLLFETEFILRIWLKVVPDYAIVFTRLVLINTLLESFTYVMGASIQATGKIKLYQVLVGSTILLNLPLSYLFLKWQYTPSVIFIISIVISGITLLQRLWILKQIANVRIIDFVIQVFGRCVLVTSLACVIPGMLGLSLNAGWGRFISITLACSLSVLLTGTWIGLNKKEKIYGINRIKQCLERRR